MSEPVQFKRYIDRDYAWFPGHRAQEFMAEGWEPFVGLSTQSALDLHVPAGVFIDMEDTLVLLSRPSQGDPVTHPDQWHVRAIQRSLDALVESINEARRAGLRVPDPSFGMMLRGGVDCITARPIEVLRAVEISDAHPK